MDELDIHSLRARINPAYANTPGTESYERRQCVDEIDALRARIAELEREKAEPARAGAGTKELKEGAQP